MRHATCPVLKSSAFSILFLTDCSWCKQSPGFSATVYYRSARHILRKKHATSCISSQETKQTANILRSSVVNPLIMLVPFQKVLAPHAKPQTWQCHSLSSHLLDAGQRHSIRQADGFRKPLQVEVLPWHDQSLQAHVHCYGRCTQSEVQSRSVRHPGTGRVLAYIHQQLSRHLLYIAGALLHVFHLFTHSHVQNGFDAFILLQARQVPLLEAPHWLIHGRNTQLAFHLGDLHAPAAEA